MPIPSLSKTLPVPSPQPVSIGQAIDNNSQNFGSTLSQIIDSVNTAQIEGDSAITSLQAGKTENLHEVMIKMEEADLSMRTMVQLRNKVLSAYQEIMRIQI